MVDNDELYRFIEPYYKGKDIVHDMWHIELVGRQMKKIIKAGGYKVNDDYIRLALAFHGFIYSDEEKVREFLRFNGYTHEDIEMIVAIA